MLLACSALVPPCLQPINLHLFEPRYRFMMERIMAAGKGGRRRFGHVGTYRPGVGEYQASRAA